MVFLYFEKTRSYTEKNSKDQSNVHYWVSAAYKPDRYPVRCNPNVAQMQRKCNPKPEQRSAAGQEKEKHGQTLAVCVITNCCLSSTAKKPHSHVPSSSKVSW